MLAYHVPGVYQEPQPRAAETPIVRTDSAVFIGFDPRVRNGTHRSELTGSPVLGHDFRVDVAAVQLTVGAVRSFVPATRDFVLAHGDGTTGLPAIPIASGQSIVYALVV